MQQQAVTAFDLLLPHKSLLYTDAYVMSQAYKVVRRVDAVAFDLFFCRSDNDVSNGIDQIAVINNARVGDTLIYPYFFDEI